jgi:hypothetical protein
MAKFRAIFGLDGTGRFMGLTRRILIRLHATRFPHSIKILNVKAGGIYTAGLCRILNFFLSDQQLLAFFMIFLLQESKLRSMKCFHQYGNTIPAQGLQHAHTLNPGTIPGKFLSTKPESFQ